APKGPRPGCRGASQTPKATPTRPRKPRACGSRGVEDPMHARKHLAREDNPLVRKPGDPRLGPSRVTRVRVINPQGHDDDARAGEVGQARSTCEVREERLLGLSPAVGRADGGKGPGQGERGGRQRPLPSRSGKTGRSDAEPLRNRHTLSRRPAKRAGPGTAGSLPGQAVEV